MGKSLGKKAGRMGFGEQLILSGIKTFFCTGLCVGWNSGQRVGERAECRCNWFLPQLPHTYYSFLPHLGGNKAGLSLTLPTL